MEGNSHGIKEESRMKKFYAFMIMVAALAACTRAEQPLNETPDQPEVPATYTLTLQAS